MYYILHHSSIWSESEYIVSKFETLTRLSSLKVDADATQLELHLLNVSAIYNIYVWLHTTGSIFKM